MRSNRQGIKDDRPIRNNPLKKHSTCYDYSILINHHTFSNLVRMKTTSGQKAKTTQKH